METVTLFTAIAQSPDGERTVTLGQIGPDPQAIQHLLLDTLTRTHSHAGWKVKAVAVEGKCMPDSITVPQLPPPDTESGWHRLRTLLNPFQ
jgi:hypothetical protein